MNNEYYENAEDIVNAYYNGKLNDNYPMLVEAIEIIVQRVLEQAEALRNDGG